MKCSTLVVWFPACLNCLFFICYLLCRDLVCPFTNRINIDPRKSPKLSRTNQEVSRSPRLPIRKPSIGSPSLTRREFPLDDITQVKLFSRKSLFSHKVMVLPAFLCQNSWQYELRGKTKTYQRFMCNIISPFKNASIFICETKMFLISVFQQNYLAQVTSNIWGTKFKIVGLATFLPTNLGAGNWSTTLS